MIQSIGRTKIKNPASGRLSSMSWIVGVEVLLSVDPNPDSTPYIKVILEVDKPNQLSTDDRRCTMIRCIYDPTTQNLALDPELRGGKFLVSSLAFNAIRNRESPAAKGNWQNTIVQIDRILESKLGTI